MMVHVNFQFTSASVSVNMPSVIKLSVSVSFIFCSRELEAQILTYMNSIMIIKNMIITIMVNYKLLLCRQYL
jgi:hypothetical protein